MIEGWLTVIQAANLVDYHSNHIRRLLQTGQIKGRKWGQAWMVDRNSLVAYIEKMGAKGKRLGPKKKPLDLSP